MKILPNLLIVAGFCLGTLGAAGFDEPPEDYAVLYLVLGMIFLIAGGLAARSARRAPGEHVGGGSGVEGFLATIETIRDAVVKLDDGRATLSSAEIHGRIDDLLRDDYFDLTSRNEELIALLGFNNYAKVWDGVASAERLLARCWSMITDGHDEEGLSELPLARTHIEHAATQLATLTGR